MMGPIYDRATRIAAWQFLVSRDTRAREEVAHRVFFCVYGLTRQPSTGIRVLPSQEAQINIISCPEKGTAGEREVVCCACAERTHNIQPFSPADTAFFSGAKIS